jgi:hypothetical protein
MYSFLLLSFDSRYYEINNSSSSPLPTSLTNAPLFQANQRLLVRIHRVLLDLYRKKMANRSSKRNLEQDKSLQTQLALYFEFLHLLPTPLQREIFSISSPDQPVSIPLLADQPKVLSSSTHLQLSSHMRLALKKSGSSTSFSVEDEFYGLKGKILPVDIVIRKKNKIAAFIEVDGPSHGKSARKVGIVSEENIHRDLVHVKTKEQLRRDDLLKQSFYEYYYPEVPLYRVYVNDIQQNVSDVGKEMMQNLK